MSKPSFVVAIAFFAVAAGCAEVEPSPRGHSPWRPVLVVNAVAPPHAVLQGEGGPIEVSVTNAGFIPVRAIELKPEAAVDDGDFFQVEKAEGQPPVVSPELQPGEVARATAIARPDAAGEAVVRRFRIHYADPRLQGKSALRSKSIEVKLQVVPAAVPLEDARSRARVGSRAPGVFSATLQLWGFEQPDGLVIVPPEGEATTLPGLTLRAFAWADLFVGNVRVRMLDEEAHEKLSQDVKLLDDAHNPGVAMVEEGHLGEFFAFAALHGYEVDAEMDGNRRMIVVRNPTPAQAPAPAPQ